MNADQQDGKAAFERRVRTFLAAHAPLRAAGAAGFGRGDDGLPGLSDSSADEQARTITAGRQWQRTLYDHGFGWIDGPPAYGGAALGPEEVEQFQRIEAEFEVPPRDGLFVGFRIVAPALEAHGSAEQKEELLPLLFRGDRFASLLLSEPGRGSDLGATATTAVRDGEEWRIDGQKGWGSYAQFSDLALILTRTDPTEPKERGLTAFLLDLRQPGIEIHPMRQMTGGAHFSDVFLSGALVPDSRRLGDVGDGWRVAMTAVSSERASAGASHDAPPDALIDRLAQLWERTDATPAVRAAQRDRAAHAAVLGRVLELTSARLTPGPGRPGPEASMTKLARNRFLAAAVDTGCAVAGAGATADDGSWGRYAWGQARLAVPGFRLAGGSDEIQRNIVAERLLGLPREPRPAAAPTKEPPG